jgi:hypothetical protein
VGRVMGFVSYVSGNHDNRRYLLLGCELPSYWKSLRLRRAGDG